MNFKTTAIALAVAGSIAAPMAAQADVYASARIGLKNIDTGGVSETTVGGVASRFGIKSETDLGNGMTGFGKYEWGVSTEGAGVLSRRHAYVGLKGDFGSVLVGQTYHTFYNHVVGPLDIPWVGSGFAMVDYVGRTAEALTYAGGADAISYGATLYFNKDATATTGEEGLNGVEVAATFGIGDMSLGVGVRDLEAGTSADDPDPVIGVTLSGIGLGGASLGVGLQSQEDDTSITLELDVGNIYVHYEMLDLDANSKSSQLASADPDNIYVADSTPSIITVGYNQSLGSNTMMYYELNSIDADTGNSDDDTVAVYAILKYDIQ
jgi:predicted porin